MNDGSCQVVSTCELLQMNSKHGVNIGYTQKITVAKLGQHLVCCPWRTGVKLCKKVDRTSMMKSRGYDETKKCGGLLRKNRQNTVARLGLHLVSCPWRTGVKICKTVDRTPMMKSRAYDETKKKWGSNKEKQKLHLF